jgi:4-hydroxybenzoate polyprenyltransferase
LTTKNSLNDQLVGLIQLTRWREHVTFVIPLTILGALLAVQNAGGDAGLDWRLVAVTLANILAVAYAFMINDIEDAPDDARDPARAIKNPITSGRIGVRVGYTVCRVVAAATLILYAFGGLTVFIIGTGTLLLSHLYSWRPVRLKAYPVTDIVSHSLMLSGLLLLAGYFVYHSQPGIVWFVAAGATLFSVYGQLYNQLRDYDMDKAAGLYNTAIVLGEKNTRRAIYLSIGLALACLLAAVMQGVFPLWLGAALLFSVALSMLFDSQTDMRGTAAVDASAKYQMRGLIVMNTTVMVWLAAVLATQFQLL